MPQTGASPEPVGPGAGGEGAPSRPDLPGPRNRALENAFLWLGCWALLPYERRVPPGSPLPWVLPETVQRAALVPFADSGARRSGPSWLGCAHGCCDGAGSGAGSRALSPRRLKEPSPCLLLLSSFSALFLSVGPLSSSTSLLHEACWAVSATPLSVKH